MHSVFNYETYGHDQRSMAHGKPTTISSFPTIINSVKIAGVDTWIWMVINYDDPAQFHNGLSFPRGWQCSPLLLAFSSLFWTLILSAPPFSLWFGSCSQLHNMSSATQFSKSRGWHPCTSHGKSSVLEDIATQVHLCMNLSKELDRVLHDFILEYFGKFNKMTTVRKYGRTNKYFGDLVLETSPCWGVKILA